MFQIHYILVGNSKTKILPDIGFAMSELKELSFCIALRKMKQHFQKKKIGGKMNFCWTEISAFTFKHQIHAQKLREIC